MVRLVKEKKRKGVITRGACMQEEGDCDCNGSEPSGDCDCHPGGPDQDNGE